MASVEFFVPSAPRGKGSVRARVIGGHARTFKDAKTRAYENTAALFASQAMSGRPPIDQAVSVHLTAVFGVPASWSKRKTSDALSGQVMPTGRPDCSNICKSVEDSCNGIVWKDDAQVVDLWVSKRYGQIPGVHVRVELASAPVEIRWPVLPDAISEVIGAPNVDETDPGNPVGAWTKTGAFLGLCAGSADKPTHVRAQDSHCDPKTTL